VRCEGDEAHEDHGAGSAEVAPAADAQVGQVQRQTFHVQILQEVAGSFQAQTTEAQCQS